MIAAVLLLRRSAPALVLAVCLVLAGCSRTPVATLDLKISEGDWADYNRSLGVIFDRQTPAERLEFTKAIQELKYQAMTADGQSPGPEINAAVRTQIAGLTVRDVLVLGHTIKLGRKQDEEKALRRSIAMNKRLRTKPGDEASATFLASTHVNQAAQLAAVRGEIAVIESRIIELIPGKFHPVKPASAEDEVVPLQDLDEKPEPQKPSPPDKRKTA